MDEWELTVESYPYAPDPRCFSKALKTAEVVLKRDLAVFESEWTISTLFFKSVELFETIASNCKDMQWQKAVCDAFKLVGMIVDKYGVEDMYDNIVTLCLLPYTPRIREEALYCLCHVARRSSVAARDVTQLISELEEAVTCKTPLARLIGTISEFHPEMMTAVHPDDYHRVWRVYLNMLDSNKNTDKVTSAVLQGILGLFKHFGQDLPVMEFRDLYSKMTREYLMKGGCEEVCLSIIESHADLFKEFLSEDVTFRHNMWDCTNCKRNSALIALYKAVATVLATEPLQIIANTELLPRIRSKYSNTRYTALRIVRYLVLSYSIEGVSDGSDEVQVLEHELRNGKVSSDTADAISWCIDSNSLHSDKLLLSAILFYDNIPNLKRKNIIITGLLNAPQDIQTTSVILLINESCQKQDGGSNIDRYLPLWAEFFQWEDGDESTEMEIGRLVFNIAIDYLCSVLLNYKDSLEVSEEKLCLLLNLAYHILSMQSVEQFTESRCRELLQALQCCSSPPAELFPVAVLAAKHCEGSLAEFCKLIHLEKCADEEILCKSCYLLVSALNNGADRDTVLQALEIIFTRRNVETKILLDSLQTLNAILRDQTAANKERIEHIIKCVGMLKTNKYSSVKEERVLHRDVSIFLGKHQRMETLHDYEENTKFVKLKEKFYLNLQNYEDGNVYKLNIKQLLKQAVIYEDAEVLQKLLAVICVSLETKVDPDLQSVLTLVIRALCRVHVQNVEIDVSILQHAVSLCRSIDCVCALLRFIREENSPGARKMLSHTLEGLLKDSGSDDSEMLVRTVAEEALAMMKSMNAATKSGGLKVIETLLPVFNDNHALQTDHLPHFLEAILETDDVDAKNTFEMASDMFLEHSRIYDDMTIEKTADTIINSLFVKNNLLKNKFDINLYRNKVEITIKFLKKLGYKFFYEKFVTNLDSNFELLLCVVTETKMAVNDDFLSKIMKKIDVLEIESSDVFYSENVLKFLEVYSDDIMRIDNEMAVNVLRKILVNLPPYNIVMNEQQLRSCINVYKSTLNIFYAEIFQNWYQKHSIDVMFKHIIERNKEIHDINTTCTHALKKYVEFFEIYKFNDDFLNKMDVFLLNLFQEKPETYICIHKNVITNILYVILKLKSRADVKKYLENFFRRFRYIFRCFLEVFWGYFIEKPFILLDQDMKDVYMIYKDILSYMLIHRWDDATYCKMLDLTDKIWPMLAPTFEEKYAILQNISKLPIQLHPNSRPMQWAIGVATDGNQIHEQIKIIEVLCGGVECGPAYRAVAAHLPTKVSELSGIQHSAFRALLDALARNVDDVLLDIIMKLADCDQTEGWWDEAFASSTASISLRGDTTFRQAMVEPDDEESTFSVGTRCIALMRVAATLFEYQSLGVCKRLLIPLLRYGTSKFSEEFYSKILNRLLSSLNSWPRPSAGELEFMKILDEHSRAMAIITMAFEKIPITSLKDENSILYSQVQNKTASFLIKKASAFCVTLRSKNLPENASNELKMCHRRSLVENYKCLSAAICVSKPAEKFYSFLFRTSVWENMIDIEETLDLPIQAQWNQRHIFKATSVDVVGDTESSPGTGSVRTRMFLRTLSEEPWQYDLLGAPVQEPVIQDLQLVSNDLNTKELCINITALVKHAALLTHAKWVDSLVEAVAGSSHKNVRWMIAQVIFNCKEDLKPHAAALRPALLALVVETACDNNGKITLNGLHIQVIETILSWNLSEPVKETDIQNLMKTTEYVIRTAIDNGHRSNIFNYLLSILKKLFDLYNENVFAWIGFEDYLQAPEKLKYLLTILILITKMRVRIPNLLSTLINLVENCWSQDSKLLELFGYSLACETERGVAVTQYRKFLAKKRRNDMEFVKFLYNTQKGFPGVIDEMCFKVVTDLAPKLMGHYKSWCLTIISSYLEIVSEPSDQISAMFDVIDICALLQDNSYEALRIVKHGCKMMGDRLKRDLMKLVAGFCEHSDLKVRKMALEVAVEYFEDQFGPKDTEPNTKRVKLNTSPILSGVDSSDTRRVMESVSRGVIDPDPSIFKDIREKVASILSHSDLGIRTAESFLLAISLPAGQRYQNPSVCVSAFMDLLLGRMRSQPRFSDLKLRDEPLAINTDVSSGPTRLLTYSKSYRGTFLSQSRMKVKSRKSPPSKTLDVQIPISDILNSIQQFAEKNSDVAKALCVQLTRSFLTPSSPGFEAMRVQVMDMLGELPGNLTPLAIEVGRLLVERSGQVSGFRNSIEKLLRHTRITEGEHMSMLLKEEINLREDTVMSTLGKSKFESRSIKESSRQLTSIKDLQAAFGKLANWDELTIQRKQEIVLPGLPELWVSQDTFRIWMEDYKVLNTRSWFDKLISACKDESKRDCLRWLRETDRWPRRQFDVSVVMEALMKNEGDDSEIVDDIHPKDCLAEWAARIMIRKTYASMDSESFEDGQSPLIEELAWCKEANIRGLPHLVLNCMNSVGLNETKDLPLWIIERASALRSLGVLNNNGEKMKIALELIESSGLRVCESYDETLMMKELMMMLHRDVGSLNNENIDQVFANIIQDSKRVRISNKRSVNALCEIAVLHYDEVCVKDLSSKSEMITRMVYTLGLMIDLDLKERVEMLLSVILNRVEDTPELGEEVVANLLSKINRIVDCLDEFSIESIKRILNRFSIDLIDYGGINAALRSQEIEIEMKMQLKLLCDPKYYLLQRCIKLLDIQDATDWKETFDLLKFNIFENSYALQSSEYQIIFPYKQQLYEIEDFDNTEALKRTSILRRIIEDLMPKVAERKVLRLSQLCPSLTKDFGQGSDKDRCMSRILKLGKLFVVKIYEQLSVFTNAITRPVVIKVLLSDGSQRKFITKTGERLMMDSAVQRAARAAELLWGAGKFVKYSVTPLGTDSGLIEYLEDTVTLRDLISSVYDLDAMHKRMEKFITTSSLIEKYKSFCQEVPSYCLRSAIEKNCTSVEDFITKKKKFVDTLSTSLLLGCIFGVGDRHLENTLYRLDDGGMCYVDWASVGQYGVAEPTPGRLTRNIRGVVGDEEVLEAKLQKLLACLRDSHKIFVSVIKMALKMAGNDFNVMLNNIEAFLKGDANSYQIMKTALTVVNNVKHNDSLSVLTDIFGAETKDNYNVVDQVNCLLRHCTDPRILCIIRPGWEPWI